MSRIGKKSDQGGIESQASGLLQRLNRMKKSDQGGIERRLDKPALSIECRKKSDQGGIERTTITRFQYQALARRNQTKVGLKATSHTGHPIGWEGRNQTKVGLKEITLQKLFQRRIVEEIRPRWD